MTKEQFLSATLNQISQVYLGKDRCCRCGCGGDYTATSYMIKPRTADINDALVAKRLKRAKKLVESGINVDYGDTCVNISTGNNRAMTFYFDEVAK